jgi:hypothetical protein
MRFKDDYKRREGKNLGGRSSRIFKIAIGGLALKDSLKSIER